MSSECGVSLDALLAEPWRATHVPREEALALLMQLATLQVVLVTVVNHKPSVVQREPERPEQDRMLDVEEAAAMLGVTRKWIYRHFKSLPFARKLSPKVLRFSRLGLVRHLATKRL